MKKAKGLKLAALLPPALAAAIPLLLASRETIGGDWSGRCHLIQAIPLILLKWLAWKRPLWGGIFLLVLGIFGVRSFANVLRRPE